MSSPLLDLSFLTKEERKLLEKVVKEDEELRLRDRIRLGTLRQKYEVGHHHQESVTSTAQCSCCDAALGLLWNRGASCPSCGFTTCKNCRHKPHSREHHFICTVCENKWMLDIQTKKYDEETPPPRLVTQENPPAQQKDSRSQSTSMRLHGSELIKRSLTKPAKTKMKGSSTAGKKKSMAEMPSPVPLTDQPVRKRKSHARRLSSSEVTSTDSDSDKPSPSKQKSVKATSNNDAVSGSGVVSKAGAPSTHRDSYPSSKDENLGSVSRKSSSPLPPSILERASPASVKSDNVFVPVTRNTPPTREIERQSQAPQGRDQGPREKSQPSSRRSPFSQRDLDKSNFRILVGVWYGKGMLHVKVVEASGLPARGNGKAPYSYVLVDMLPDKKNKKASAIQSPTHKPVFNETFTFNMRRSEVEGKSLLVTVMDSHVLKEVYEDSFLGQVKIPLSEVNLASQKAQWYMLEDKELEETVIVATSSKEETENPLVATSMSSMEHGKKDGRSSKDTDTDEHSKSVVAAVDQSYSIPSKQDSKESTVAMPLKKEGYRISTESVPFSEASSVSLPVQNKVEITSEIQSGFVDEKNPFVEKSADPLNFGDSGNSSIPDQENSGRKLPFGDKLSVKMMFKPNSSRTAGNLLVEIQEAKLLQKASCYVTICLVSNDNQAGKKKTRMKNDSEPVWNESFIFRDVALANLEATHTLNISVINWNDNSTIGHLQFGSTSYCAPDHNRSAEESSHWKDMLCNPGSFVERWHLLRQIMEPSATRTHQSQTSTLSQTKTPPSAVTLERDPNTDLSVRYRHTDETPDRNQLTEPAQMEQNEEKTKVSQVENCEVDRKSVASSLSLYSSRESLFSTVSVCGEVLFGVWYKEGNLYIHIAKASNLGLTSESTCNPYIKTYLLPDKDKKTKKKTDAKKNTQEPEYNTTLYYQVRAEDVKFRILSLSVWDRGIMKRNHFMGEVRLPLSSVDLNDSTDCWYALGEKVPEGDLGIRSKSSAGNIQVGIMLEPNSGCDSMQGTGTLHVKIKNATDLSIISRSKLKKVSAECTLLPSEDNNKKTTSKHGRGSCPVWEETFTFSNVILCKLLEENVLQVVVRERKELIGCTRLGGHPGRCKSHQPWMDPTELEATSWEKMFQIPGMWVDEHFPLRLSLSPRQVDLTVQPPSFVTPFSSTTPRSLSLVVETRSLSPVVETENKRSLSPVVETENKRSLSPVVETAKKLTLQDLQISTLQDTISDTDETPLTESASSLEKKQLEANVGGLQNTVSSTADIKPSISTSLDSQELKPKGLELKDLESVVLEETPSYPSKSSSTSYGRIHEESPRDPFNLSVSRASMASFGSMASVYSAAGGKGSYDITGEVLLGIYYSGDQLLIHVNRARGLAAANKNGYSDPYVKTYLLPDKHKHTKKKTGIKRKTLNPVYDETIKYHVNHTELEALTLWLSVWDWDRFGRNQFLGEIRVPLSSVDLSDSADHWHSLVESTDDESSIYRGEIQLAMKIDSAQNKKGKVKWTLHVHIIGGRDLYHSESKQVADSFVKCFLLPDKSSSGKRKTGVIKNNSSPVWDEVHTFEKLSLDDLRSKRVLEVTVWDYCKGSSSEFIGGLRLGPSPIAGSTREEWMDSIGEEVNHWEDALASPVKWVEHSHTLRSTMDYRSLKLD